MSEGIYELCGISPEEVREDASPFFAIIHPEDFDGIFVSIQIAVKNLAPWSYDFRIKHNDGTERWLAGHSLPEQDVSGFWSLVLVWIYVRHHAAKTVGRKIAN